MLTKEEINRKLLHLMALLMPAGIFYLPGILDLSKWAPPLALAVILFLSILLERLRLAYPAVHKAFRTCFGSLMRHDEQKKTTGATYIIAGAFICSVTFVNFPHISFIVLVLFILGDAIAAIVGLSVGRVRIAGKSLEGSLACFGLCLTLFAVVFPHIPLLPDHFGSRIPFPLMVVTSLTVTVLELFPLRIVKTCVLNDNLYVPVLAGLVLKYLQPCF
jgi:dolichol kinase